MVTLFVLTAAPVNARHVFSLYNDSLIHKLQDFFLIILIIFIFNHKMHVVTYFESTHFIYVFITFY